MLNQTPVGHDGKHVFHDLMADRVNPAAVLQDLAITSLRPQSMYDES
jgi:hypothetical protein